jgi:hypothetical protein
MVKEGEMAAGPGPAAKYISYKGGASQCYRGRCWLGIFTSIRNCVKGEGDV